MLSPTLRGAHLHRSSMRVLVKPRRDWPESELMRHTDVPRASRRRSAASESRRYPHRDAVRCLPPERLCVDCVSRARAGPFLSPSPRSTPPRRTVPADPRRRRPSSARISRSSSADHIAMQRSPANDARVIKLARHARWHCALPNRGRHPTESPTYPLLFSRRDATAHDLALRRGYRHRPRAPVCCRFLSLIDDTHMRRSCNLSFPAREIVRSEATDAAIWHQVVARTTSY
jgi:hypothetical protein